MLESVDGILCKRQAEMRATVMYGSGDVRMEHIPDARIIEPTDAVVVTRAAICGSGLWPYREVSSSDVRFDRKSGTGEEPALEATYLFQPVINRVHHLSLIAPSMIER